MIARLGVVGGGQMGQGIAQVAAQAGLDVILVDVTPELAAAAIGKLGKTLDKLVEKGKLAAEGRDAAKARLRAGASHADLADRDFVIEAAPEKEALKLELMASLGKVTRPECILASNTSSISITKLAAASGRPERVIGMHFMNPVPIMKLVESTPEAAHIAGYIDTGVKLGLNHPMGPLELSDLIGLDTVLAIANVLHQELGDDKYRPCPLLRQHVAAGWLGKKVGRGFYKYDATGAKA